MLERMQLAILAANLVAVVPGSAQPRTFTAADYAHAEKFMGYNTTSLVIRSGVRPNWLLDERLWYRVTTAEGSEFVMTDPVRRTREPAFDHARLATAPSAATGAKYDASHLPFAMMLFPPIKNAWL